MFDDNEKTLRTLFRTFRWSAALLIAEVAAWILELLEDQELLCRHGEVDGYESAVSAEAQAGSGQLTSLDGLSTRSLTTSRTATP